MAIQNICSIEIKRYIAKELTHFLLLSDKIPESISINVIYKESVARLDLSTERLTEYFGGKK